ncbi:deoxyribose-phosphate aldolase [Actinotignum sp. GS-2025b]|uniref:deoxyribose-phosphate aldolase n=1 Tax=Actinotignum sp. GS-2025b TaxID=3427275 RepID=UPI003F46686A
MPALDHYPHPAQLIDHTLLRADTRRGEIEELCSQARDLGTASVCVNPVWVETCAARLAGSGVKVCTVIGFPLGASTSATKAFETRDAIAHGATEVDMVMDLGAARDGRWEDVETDIAAVVGAAQPAALVKVIIEICLLSDDEIVHACRAAQRAGADFVKTSTGFSSGGATEHAVALMRATVGEEMGVKAAGGIRSAADFRAMVEAGANRIGASAGVQILAELQR